MNNQAPFVDVQSFATEEGGRDVPDRETSAPSNSPFLSLYEVEEGGTFVNPETEEYATFLNELYDEEFNEALCTLVDEAASVYETTFPHEQEDPQTIGYRAERLLNQHFAPLVAETGAMLDAVAREYGSRDPSTLAEEEIGSAVDRYRPSAELTPNFEQFFDTFKKIAKKVANKAVGLAKKGVAFAAKLGLGPVLERIKRLLPQLVQRVIKFAIGKLPAHLQPIARKLASRLPSLKELEEGYEAESEVTESNNEAEIQHEFNQNIANMLFAPTGVQQELEVAQALSEDPVSETYPLAELDSARDQFVSNLERMKEGEDPTPLLENFVPAILPALRIGIRLIGRKRVVSFLAKFLGTLIQKFVGPQYAPALSQAIVDAGLRLLSLEIAPEHETRAASSAVAATVEETVRRVAALPDYILDDQELLEGFALEAFEQAAAANLPPVLPSETYRRRPDLGEAIKLRGTWILMPFGRRKRYKKFSRRVPARITPNKVATIETYEGASLQEFMEEQFDVAPGEEVEAFVHLYEAIPGTRVSGVARMEDNVPGLGSANGHEQFHPLTPEAAALLLGEPELGREMDPQYGTDPHATAAGQRFYYLEIPGRRRLMSPEQIGRAKPRRTTRVRLIFDFPKNEMRIYLFLSEVRAQEVAVKLRQKTHIGLVTARLRKFLDRGLRSALTGASGRLKIVHEAVTPQHWTGAIQRLPSLVPQILLGRLTEWAVKGLSDSLKQRTEEFIKAAEDTADGVTVAITFENPPGFPELRMALKGKSISLGSLKISNAAPTVKIKIMPGYVHE